MTRLAITPRSFRTVPGRHSALLADAGIEVRYPSLERILTEAEMIELVRGCDGLIVGLDPVTARVLEAGPLRVVVKYGSGLDNIDLEAARVRQVEVRTTPGANSQAVAELTIGLLFALARHLVAHHLDAQRGTWTRRIGRELAGRRLGVIGYGQIGRRVASLGLAVGMEVVAHDPYVERADVPLVDLAALIESADAVSLHVPLTPETRHLVDATFLGRMRRGAWLVNTARGGLVDLAALAEALVDGHLGGAAIDDFEEPPPPESTLWQLPNFIASPHAGATTVEAVERTGVAAVEAALSVLARAGGGSPMPTAANPPNREAQA
ncbi:MAG: 2-hydroxyacid dehydrogenase [Chloroflexota bacterium]|nr:MAG: 2-hydroxyacid dehydrogenase [Chloroflexota bacterium]